MNKLVLSALAAAALAGSAYTITAFAAPGGPEAAMHEADRGFMLDAKLAGMKAALKLTPEQDKLWPAFEASVRDADKSREETRKQWREEREGAERPSPIAMMSQMSESLARASETLKKVADTAKPLYDSLDDGQKRHFGPARAYAARGPRPARRPPPPAALSPKPPRKERPGAAMATCFCRQGRVTFGNR